MALLIPLLILIGILGFSLGGDMLDISLSPTAPIELALKKTGWIEESRDRSSQSSPPILSAPRRSTPASSPSAASAPPPPQPQEPQEQGTLQIQSFRPTNNGKSQHFRLVLRPQNLSSPLSLTGWKVESRWAGSFTIGKGIESFHPSLNSSNNEPILVRPGDTVIISGEAGPLGSQVNFRENQCFGYLKPYYPKLSGSYSCSVPKPKLQDISHLLPSCQEYILNELSYSSCLVSEIPTAKLDSQCREFVEEITEQMNYTACYQKRAQDPNFLSSTWYLYQNREFGHPLHDVITIKDAQGNIVDQYTY